MPPDVHQAQVSAETGLVPLGDEATVTDWFIDGSVPTIRDVEAPFPDLTPTPIPTPTATPDD